MLDAPAAERALAWPEAPPDSDEARRLAAGSPPLRPVLFGADRRILGYVRLSAKTLGRELDRQTGLGDAKRQAADATGR